MDILYHLPNPSNQINFSIFERKQGIAKITDEMEA